MSQPGLVARRVPWYNPAMTPQLGPELRQVLPRQPGRPLEVEDPVTHAQYVLVRLDAYEQMQRSVDDDTSDPDPRLFYPAFAAAVKDDMDALGPPSLGYRPFAAPLASTHKEKTQ